MKIVIDRIESNYAVAELPDGTFVNLPLGIFENPSEGDVFVIEKNQEETEKRESEINDLMKDLFR